MAKSFSGLWGLDDEGEIVGVWKDCGIERMWYMLGVFFFVLSFIYLRVTMTNVNGMSRQFGAL